MESIRYPIQVHSEYDAFVNLFTDSTALQEGVLNETDCDYDYILSCSFFILTEGVGIMVDENSPHALSRTRSTRTISHHFLYFTRVRYSSPHTYRSSES